MNQLEDMPGNYELDTALVPLAGLGMRMYPFTAEIPKFMASVTDGERYVPNINYTLADCLDAGIKNFVFITGRGGEEVLKHYLGPIDPKVEEAMVGLGKIKELAAEKDRRAAYAEANDISLSFIEQPMVGKYGTAIPVALARSALSGVEQFAVYGGDDFLWHPDGTSELNLALKGWRRSGQENAIMGKSIARQDGSKYGILQQTGNVLAMIDEKPPLERIAEEPLANISRYIVNQSIWPYVDDYLEQPRDANQKEYYFTDVINAAVADGHGFYVHTAQGVYLDAGSPPNILAASNFLSSQQS